MYYISNTVYTVLAARILNMRPLVLAVSNHNRKSKPITNPNSDSNPIPNLQPHSLLQSRCEWR